MNEIAYRSVIVDTLNGLQNNLYNTLLQNKGKASYDDWKDFGVEIYDFYRQIKELPDTVLVQILGDEGTGKTVAGSFLNPDETCWLNTDAKPLSFFGARQKYPTDNSKKNYSVPASYEKALVNIRSLHAKRKGTFIVFILAHIEDYKSGLDMRQRLKVLGKQATKLGIEGLNLIHTYYTKVDPMLAGDDANRYKLRTINSGFDTARSPQGYWQEPEIQANYQLIVNKILEDFGEKP